jgi:site-specific DNA recombinase
MPVTDLVPAIGYIRVSTWYEDKISDEIQKAAIKETAQRRGRIITRWIYDLDETGRSFRRKIMLAITAVEHGEVSEIWVWKYSRFGRNRHGVAVNLARIEKAGGQLRSATEDIDATTATGRFTRGMLLEVAAFESDRTGETWRETHQWRREHGLPATGGRRFGYIWTPRKTPDGQLQAEGYDPDPVTGRVLGEMYERHVGGQGLWGIAGWLNDIGQTNNRGLRWTNNGVTRYLDSGFGAGVLYVHNSKARCGLPSGCLKPDHYIHIPGAHPAVIGDDLWAAYQARRKQRREMSPRTRKPVFMLSGLLKCGHCGGPAVAGYSSGVPGFGYRCSWKWTRVNHCQGIWYRRAWVERDVRAWVAALANELDRLIAGQELRRAAQEESVDQAAGSRAAAEIVRLTQALDTATEKLALGLIPDDAYMRTRDSLRRQIAAKEAAVEQLRTDVRSDAGQLPTRDFLDGLMAEWDEMPIQTLRDSLATIIRHIVIRPHLEPQVLVVPVWEPLDAAVS